MSRTLLTLLAVVSSASAAAKKDQPAPQAFETNCKACHMTDRALVGPHFVHIQEHYPLSKRSEFLEWCRNPGKRNPNMPQMPSMAHIPEAELIEIHNYILNTEVKRVKKTSNKDLFPDTKRPRVVRSFWRNTAPTSILIALPTAEKLNVVWDSEACRLRYISQGEADNFPYLRSNGNSESNPGKIIYTENQTFGTDAQPVFKGYRIDKDGFPTFLYTIDGQEITEQISSSGESVVRTFTGTTPAFSVTAADDTSVAVSTTSNTITYSLK